MKIIVYKLRLGSYEIAKITDSPEGRISFIFDEPIDAKLMLSGRVCTVRRGRGELDIRDMSDGSYTPRLISASGTHELESFRLFGGAISHREVSDERIRTLIDTVSELLKKSEALEKKLSEIESKMESRLEF